MRVGGYAGIATPIVWFALLMVAGAMVSGYDPVRQYMTELTDGPTWVLVESDFALGALLMGVFAAGLATAVGHDRWSLAIVLLVLVKAGATLGTGLVHGDVDPLVRTPSGQMHNMLIALGNVALAIACVIAAWRFPMHEGWGGLVGYNVATASVTIVLLVALATLTTAGTGRADAPLAAVGGLLQRVSMLVTDLWPAVIGWRMLRLARARSSLPLRSHT
ncbi:MAG TPA: DUF998 domain-containing protein [Candidatus Limnocylindria bacterium]